MSWDGNSQIFEAFPCLPSRVPVSCGKIPTRFLLFIILQLTHLYLWICVYKIYIYIYALLSWQLHISDTLLSFQFSCFSWPFPQYCTLSPHKSAPWFRPACCKVRCISKLFGLAKKKKKNNLKFDRLTPIKTSRYQINRFERFGALQKITALKQLLCSWQLCDNFDIESKALSLHCCTSWLTASTEASKSSWLANATPTDHHFLGSCVLWWLKDSKMKWMNKIRLMNGEHK